MKKLYEVALLEGEGLGTAYEYYMKRMLLNRLFFKFGIPRTICVFGVPEKYGSSMDFCLLAGDVKADSVTIYDEREQAVKKCRIAAEKVKERGIISDLVLEFSQKEGMELKGKQFDFITNCDVFQRFEEEKALSMINDAASNSSYSLFFLPNGYNVNHVASPDRKAIDPVLFVEKVKKSVEVLEWGYVDMPPFPSGSRISEQKRSAVKSGIFSFGVFLVLKLWAVFEAMLPFFIKKKFAHAFYIIVRRK
jgi:hypothetical protein